MASYTITLTEKIDYYHARYEKIHKLVLVAEKNYNHHPSQINLESFWIIANYEAMVLRMYNECIMKLQAPLEIP